MKGSVAGGKGPPRAGTTGYRLRTVPTPAGVAHAGIPSGCRSHFWVVSGGIARGLAQPPATDPGKPSACL